MTGSAQDITTTLTQEAQNKDKRDWGVEPNDNIEVQFREDLGKIREAELTAKREATSLRVF